MLTPQFIAGSRGKIFALWRHPRERAFGESVLFVAPFAEEMNKCRRMLSLVADGLVRSGIASIIVDFYGTGDSEGEFAEADRDVWLTDLDCVVAWAAKQEWPVQSALCVRTGCLFGAHFARSRGLHLRTTVFWQPVTNGGRFLTQFLRFRVAAAMASEGPSESAAELRAKLEAGESVEVAGYELSGRFAAQIDTLELSDGLGPHMGALHWMELVRDTDRPLSASSSECLDMQRASGPVQVHRMAGEPFWSSTEIVVNRAMIDATVQAFTNQVIGKPG